MSARAEHLHWNLYGLARRCVVRARYWKLTPGEMAKLAYNPDRLLNWDVKLVREPEESAIFIGIFMYRNGTPLGYEAVKGVVYYYNRIDRDELPKITGFLKGRLGGNVREKGDRVFLENSDEIYSAGDIASLAREAETKLNAKATITLEFAGVTEEELKEAGMPEAKLLPIPGASN